ncbi:MAG: NAD-dependent epimerase/dehydratase family protein, partial [Candidatus Omnitrophica bacterium]|nr:NAD-dependent epimerase/dehydratase family protein [Candidatus Omnitrophota bacterium]
HDFSGTSETDKEFYQVNVEGTRLLLKMAKKNNVRRMVFYSTVGVYGQDSDFAGDELSPCTPHTAYAQSKLAAEQEVLKAANNGGPEGVVLRFPVVYGPLDRGNIANLIEAIYHKRFIFFGKGQNVRSMISAKNTAIAAYLASIQPQARGQVFLATDGDNYTLNTLIETICAGLEMKWRPPRWPYFFGRFAGNIGDLFENITSRRMPFDSERLRKLFSSLTFSTAKIIQELGYKSQDTLEAGIKDEIAWLKTVKKWN